MNIFIIITTILITISSSLAQNCTEQSSKDEVKEIQLITTDVPNHLKGAIITIKLMDGRESSVPAEKFKVVPRVQQVFVTKVEHTKVLSCITNKSNKNRISVSGGYGSKGGLNISNNGSVVEVESKVGAVGGLQYQRMLNETFSVGVQGQTNNTASLLLGIDF